ncbi:MAG TPA: N-formylglutamate amidohydrolase [Ramlibacter sp.]|nr:N-formylglutamate amidohydrolase [Ramlibacter sp.]
MSFVLTTGTAPLLVSMPHIGTDIPAPLQAAFAPRALKLQDTDWHLERLYAFLPALGASVLQPRLSRYVIDLNRPPDDAPMYPGAANTELCPTRFFNGEPLYRESAAPDAQERGRRLAQYWQPYHQALAGGAPERNVHAVQLEMVQKLYMQEEAPFAYDPARAAAIQPVLRDMVIAALDAARALHGR